MKLKKSVILKLLILIMLSYAVLTGCSGMDKRPEKALNTFSKMIEKQKIMILV